MSRANTVFSSIHAKVKKHFEGTELALLLPKRPQEDVVSLLESLGVGCVVETAPGAFVDATSLKRCPS